MLLIILYLGTLSPEAISFPLFNVFPVLCNTFNQNTFNSSFLTKGIGQDEMKQEVKEQFDFSLLKDFI